MTAKNEVYVSLVSRTNSWPDGIAMVDTDGKQWTYAEYYEKGPYSYHRNDICLVGVNYANPKFEGEQYAVYPTTSGEPSWGEALKYLSAAEIKECRAENQRMLKIAAESEVYAKAMGLKPPG